MGFLGLTGKEWFGIGGASALVLTVVLGSKKAINDFNERKRQEIKEAVTEALQEYEINRKFGHYADLNGNNDGFSSKREQVDLVMHYIPEGLGTSIESAPLLRRHPEIPSNLKKRIVLRYESTRRDQ